MRFRLLGPLEVWDGERWSAIRSGQQRTVLAVLLIEVGRVVSTDRLVDEIWGERPPRTAANAVQGYVMRLRKLMGDHRPLHTIGRCTPSAAATGSWPRTATWTPPCSTASSRPASTT